MTTDNRKRGFTLMEMLIVVAVIAVLVAIAIPIMSSSTDKAQETTDIANLRSAFACAQTASLNGAETVTVAKTEGGDFTVSDETGLLFSVTLKKPEYLTGSGTAYTYTAVATEYTYTINFDTGDFSYNPDEGE